MGCHSDLDYDIGDWKQCPCGAYACMRCAGLGCPRCRSDQWAAQPADLGRNDSTCYNMEDMEVFPEQRAETLDENGRPTEQARLEAAVGALQCYRCMGCSLTGRAHWRICTCRTTYCEDCFSLPCLVCEAHHTVCGGRETDADGAGEGLLRDWDVDQLSSGDERYPEEPNVAYNGCPFEGDFLHVATVLSPKQALDRRDQLTKRMHEERAQSRKDDHERRREQEKRGRRPAARRQPGGATVAFGTANVTTGSSWQDEMEFGTVINALDYAAIQEHRLGQDDRERAGTRLREAGWDPQIDKPYWKSSGYGGGDGHHC